MEPTALEPELVLLKVDEAAKLLRIGRTRVYDLIRTKDLQSVKIFNSRLIPRTAIDGYIATLLEESEAA